MLTMRGSAAAAICVSVCALTLLCRGGLAQEDLSVAENSGVDHLVGRIEASNGARSFR